MLIAVVGIVGFFGLSVREYPDVDPPVVSVQTQYIGAAASVVETRVTQVLEEQLSGVEGLQTITSRSQDGQSSITIEFIAGRVDRIGRQRRPRPGRRRGRQPARRRPTARGPQGRRRRRADPVPRRLQAGLVAAAALRLCRPQPARPLLVDRGRRPGLHRRRGAAGDAGLDAARAARRLRPDPGRRRELRCGRQNVELPAGRLESAQQNVTLRVDRPFANARAVPRSWSSAAAATAIWSVSATSPGSSRGRKIPIALFRLNGQPAVGLGIVRQSGANTLAVAEAAKAMAAQVLSRPCPKGWTIVVGSDESLFISRAIEKVWETLAEAAVLVVLVIYLFLGSWRATLIPAVTVPLCLLASFAVLWVFGFSINLLTLLAMVLSIGIVVDDAIVVLENVYHRIEEGEPPLAAAFDGTRQVGFAIALDDDGGLRGVRADHVHRRPDRPPVPRARRGDDRRGRLLGLPRLEPGADALLEAAPPRGARPPRRAGSTTASAGSRSFYARRLDGVLRKPLIPLVGRRPLPRRRRRRCSSRSSPSWCRPRMSASSTPTSPRRKAPATPQMDRYMVDAQARLLPLVEQGRGPRADHQRTPGGFGPSDDFNSGTFVVFLKPWEEREETTQEVVDEVNRDARPDPGGARQRPGPLLARAAAAASRSTSSSPARPMPISPAPATGSSPPPPTIPASSTSTATIRRPSRSCGSRSIPRAPAISASRSPTSPTRSRPCSARAGSRPMSTAARNIGSIVQAEAGGARDRGQSRQHLRAQPHRRRWCRSSNLVTVTRHRRRARPRPLQQAARDHPLRRPRARLFARRGADLPRSSRRPARPR